MKKILLYLSVFILSLYFIYNKNLNGIIALIIIVSITILFIKYEKGSYGTKEISLLATLAGVAGGLRILMAPFPNIQPTTFLVALTGYVFGPFEGLLVGALAAFISNMFLGQGPWTIFQMLGWGVIGFISAYLPSKTKKPMGKIKFSVILFFYGFLFDYIVELWYVLFFLNPVNIKTILFAYSTGFLFDLFHGLSNFIFSIVFYKSFYIVLLRYKNKLRITYIQGGKQ